MDCLLSFLLGVAPAAGRKRAYFWRPGREGAQYAITKKREGERNFRRRLFAF